MASAAILRPLLALSEHQCREALAIDVDFSLPALRVIRSLDQVIIAEVQDFATQWMWSCNHERPNMALGGITPKQRLAMAA